MHPYDVRTALEELKEDAMLPHPVRLRDMILRTKLAADEARDLNREFQTYLTQYGEIERLAGEILVKLSAGESKTA